MGKNIRNQIFNKRILTLSFLLFIFVLFFILNCYTPLYADDYNYSYSFFTGKRILSLYDILKSQIFHYYNVNGRSITHTVAQIFLLLGKNQFNIINSFTFVLLGLIIYYHSFGNFHDIKLGWLCFIFMSIFLEAPSFGESFLWITGSSNYMYGILILLLFLTPYRKKCIEKDNSECPHKIFYLIYSIIFFILGIIAGWTNENTSAASIVIIILFLIAYRMKNIKFKAWMLLGLIGNILGFLFMVFAPGEGGRLSNAGGVGNVFIWMKRLVFYTCDMFKYFQILFIIFTIIFVIYYIDSKYNLKIKIFNSYLFIIYLCGFFISIYSMVIPPYFPERVWSGPLILFIIAIGNLYSLIPKTEVIKKFSNSILVILIIITLSTYVSAYFDIKNTFIEYTNRIDYINESIVEGKYNISIPAIKGYTKYSCYSRDGDLIYECEKWPNTSIAKYYGLNSIKREAK